MAADVNGMACNEFMNKHKQVGKKIEGGVRD
jgi:hypothetical protein